MMPPKDLQARAAERKAGNQRCICGHLRRYHEYKHLFGTARCARPCKVCKTCANFVLLQRSML